MVTSQELRTKYLDFFKSKNHTIIDGASLIPENDPTVLFTTAGMHPLVPYLLGEKHPGGQRLVNVQKCIRTGDIEEVGDATHLTFFEMLGNWSLGDLAASDGIGKVGYFKKETIEYSWEFLTSPDWLGISPKKLAVTVFAGTKSIPRDEESAKVWKALGVPEHKIAYLKDNWWGPAGATGPCGPDTEIFYWVGAGDAPPKDSDPGNDEANWVEIWNNVLMEYNKVSDESFEPLQQKNVDTGMGFERVVAVLNGYESVYEVDTIKPIYDHVYNLAVDKENTKALRVITDHVRAAVYIMGDDRGVSPSNLDQGYVVRRLLRTAIRRGREVGINKSFLAEVAAVVIGSGKEAYPELSRNQERVLAEITTEENKFEKVLVEGEKKVREYLEDGVIDGKEAFQLYSTYGFPVEEIQRLGVQVDLEAFYTQLREHQDVSRQGSEQKFAGGLADHSEETTRLHTATHLLHKALRDVLGDHVIQKGSNITAKRLRFDFSHGEKLTPEQLQQVEDVVNEQIKAALPVVCEEMTVAEAKQAGAIGLFTQKYAEKIKVYTIGKTSSQGESVEPPFSREICGGPHVANTSELGTFKIKKEQASSSGVRRIKATLSSE